MAVTGVTGTSILLKIRWRYANMLIFHLHNLLKPGFSPGTWHCIFPSLAVDGSKRPQDEKPLALVISCTWSMLPWRHDVRWSRVWRSLGHQRFEAKIFMLWDAQPKSVLLQPSDHPSFTNYYILLHINTIIMLHPWNQRSPSNRCDLKLSAAYMLLQHVDRDTDVSPIHFLSWISMLKQFCVPTRHCKLTTGWPFWCHGDSHGKASHGRMDSSRVHYAMWGDHKNTKRLQVVFESLTCLLNLLNCFWFLVPISGCSAGPYPLHRDGWVGLLDHRRGRAAFVSDVFRISKSVAEVGSVGRIQDLLGRGIGQWVHEGSLIAFQLDLFQYEAGVELNMDTVYWTWITWAHCSEYTVCIAKTIDLNIRSYYFCIIFIFIFTYLFDDTLIHPESIQISSRSEATSKKHVQHSA